MSRYSGSGPLSVFAEHVGVFVQIDCSLAPAFFQVARSTPRENNRARANELTGPALSFSGFCAQPVMELFRVAARDVVEFHQFFDRV